MFKLFSFFGGKLQFGIVAILLLSLAGLSFTLLIEKNSHGNTKVELGNSQKEVMTLKTINNALMDDQENKQNVIKGLKNQVDSYKKEFASYRQETEKMLQLCTEAKEIPIEESTLEVLDEKSNKQYIDAINSVLGVN